jgi:predicted TIM-barrel fold metal-dependent hydrolase
MKTAVEWLIEAMYQETYPFNPTYSKIFEQAKEMEKHQIIESYCQGCFDISKDDGIVPRETSDKYYHETFKQD